MRHFVAAALATAWLLSGRAVVSVGDEIEKRVAELAAGATPAVVAWRRDIHAHPELSNREERTAALVAKELRALGVDEVQTGVAHHGVVGLVRGKKAGLTVALRADMDALPVQEQTGLEFASRNPGVMHACGHDAHTAILLGTAKVLMQIREELPGNVKLIFQPAEEGVPSAEQGGAALMIKEGVLDNPRVAAIFGLHVNPEMDAGKVAYRFGSIMASVDRFKVTIAGRQSHAAMPWQGVDPIVASAHVIAAIQTIASRKVDAREPIVVSVGIVRGGTAWNIIPGEVVLEGTIRTHNEAVRRQAREEFARIVEKTADAQGAKATIEHIDYGPAVWNDPELGRAMLPTLARAAGRDGVVDSPLMMGGEDFALYAKRVPGMFVFLGARNEKTGCVHPLHTPLMRIDEAALPLGVRTMTLLAVDFLQNHRQEKP